MVRGERRRPVRLGFCPILGDQLHVRAAPADEEIHHVHDGVFVGLRARCSQLPPCVLEHGKNSRAVLAVRKQLLGQRTKDVNRLG